MKRFLKMPLMAGAIIFGLTGCFGPDYEPLTFERDGSTIVARGVIDASSLDAFEDIEDDLPSVDRMIIANIPGSADDEANLELSLQLHAQDLEFILPANGMIASGGVDLFLAGAKRIVENGACIGVHSWGGGGVEGADLPKEHEEHQKYLDYYAAIGIDGAFYWFTLEAAPAAEIHWMSAEEAMRYGVSSNSVSRLGNATDCDPR